jgi:hypothetical protein
VLETFCKVTVSRELHRLGLELEAGRGGCMRVMRASALPSDERCLLDAHSRRGVQYNTAPRFVTPSTRSTHYIVSETKS